MHRSPGKPLDIRRLRRDLRKAGYGLNGYLRTQVVLPDHCLVEAQDTEALVDGNEGKLAQ